MKEFARALNRKHRDLLHLEESLFASRKAGRVIAASQMVKREIVDLYGYPADKIDIVHNGVPLAKFRFDSELQNSREDFGLKPDQIAVLFAGSGWERKGLLFADPGGGALQEQKNAVARCWPRKRSALQDETPALLA